nr:hypothetical protein [Tanacetum cinerariifolium]
MSSNNTDITNKAVNTAHGVSAAISKTNAFNLSNVDSLSDAVIYSFFASQSNSPQLDNEDLQQIDPDDLEEIDLKWQMTMLTMRARRFLQKTRRNLGVKGTNTIVKTRQRNMEAPRRTVPVEDTTSNAFVSQCDGLGYNWSDQAEDRPTNFALMAYTSSSSSSFSNSDTEFNLGAYKAGLESVEAKLEVYKKNEAVFIDDIKILKLDVMFRDKAITELRQKFEKAKKERDDLKLTLEKFQDSSKNLSRLLDSQQSDKSKTGLGYDSQGFDSLVLENQVNEKYNTCKRYHAVPPSYTGNFMPPKPDLVFTDEHVVNESVTSLPGIAKSEVKTSETTLKNVSTAIIKDWVSDSENEDEIETKSKQIKPSFAKVKFVKPTEYVKSPRKSVKQEESNRQTKYPRKNGQSPRVLTNSGLKTLDTAKQTSSKAAVSVNTIRPINTAYPRSTVNGVKPSSNVFHKSHSPVRRTFNQRTTPKNSDLKEKVYIAKGNPQYTLQDQGIFDSGCSRHMTGNKSILTDYQEIDGGFVAFGGSPKVGIEKHNNAGQAGQEKAFDHEYTLLPFMPSNNLPLSSST